MREFQRYFHHGVAVLGLSLGQDPLEDGGEQPLSLPHQPPLHGQVCHQAVDVGHRCLVLHIIGQLEGHVQQLVGLDQVALLAGQVKSPLIIDSIFT